MEHLPDWLLESVESLINYLISAEFLFQIAGLFISYILAIVCGKIIRKSVFKDISARPVWLQRPLNFLVQHLSALPALCFVAILFVTLSVLEANGYPVGIVQMVQGISIIVLFYLVFFKYIQNSLLRFICLYIFFPILLLYVVGYLGETINHLENTTFQLGNISFSLLTLTRIVIFGIILFWLGRLSNNLGKTLIKSKLSLDETAKELTLKAFQISLFVLVGIIFLQIAGIDLTALVVLGGAFGVGLGFGLQQIASNFISGIIILTDRTLKIGDYIEMEDGRAGFLTELSMRSATLESFEGRDVMVPNERFITTSFTNWTHHSLKQRYSLHVSVAYDTDLDFVFDLIRKLCSAHPQIFGLDHPDSALHPDAEIEAFEESGIKLLIEFWMEGIDDGKNKVGADIKYRIWKAFKENDIVIPYPQREVRLMDK